MPEILSRATDVARWLQTNRCITTETISGRPPEEWESFAAHSKEAPFSAVLDEIAVKSGNYFWYAMRERGEPCIINVGFWSVGRPPSPAR